MLSRQAVWLIPLVFLLASFGRLVAHPSSLLVDASRPTVDRARVVAATPGNDLTRQFWPLHFSIARTLARTGHLPEWDDRGFGGRPLVGNPQAGLFYPPVWLAWLIPLPAILGWITLGHLVWASVGMGRLGRTLGLGDAGRIMASGCLVLCPYVLAQTFEGHYPHVWAVAWYPWAFDATIRLGRGEWRAVWSLPLCLAAVLLVGHPQEGYYLAIALGVWATGDLARQVSRRQSLRTIGLWLLVGLLSLGLFAAELIPSAWAQDHGLRSGRLPLRLASRYHPSAINALQLLNPFALGGPADYFGPENYWETVVSVGLIPLILAGVGVAWTRDRHRLRGWVVLLVVASLFAGGRKLGLFALMYEWIPGMDRFRVPSRSLFLANLAVAVLAGFGVEAIRSIAGERDRWVRLTRRWFALLVVLAVASLWGGWRTRQGDLTPASFGSSTSVEELRSASRVISDRDRLALGLSRLAGQPMFGLAVLGLSGGLVWGCWRPEARQRVALGLGLLGLVESAGSGYELLRISPPSAFLERGELAEAINVASPARHNSPPVRIRADEAVVPDLVAVDLGLSKTDLNDNFQIQRAADLYERLFDLSRPRPIELSRPMDGPVAARVERIQQAILDRMAVAVVVTDRQSPRLHSLLEQARSPIVATLPERDGQPGGRVVVRNPTATPRAYVVPQAEVVASDDLRLVDRFADFDPRQAVLMTRDPLAGVSALIPRQPFRTVDWASSDPDRLVLRVATAGPCLLVVADTWMPGWTAQVDGRSAEVERGNHAQRVVALPTAGTHEVIMAYRAPGFRLGLAISAGSAIAWLAAWLVSRRRMRTLGSEPARTAAVT